MCSLTFDRTKEHALVTQIEHRLATAQVNYDTQTKERLKGIQINALVVTLSILLITVVGVTTDTFNLTTLLWITRTFCAFLWGKCCDFFPICKFLDILLYMKIHCSLYMMLSLSSCSQVQTDLLLDIWIGSSTVGEVTSCFMHLITSLKRRLRNKTLY